MGLPVTGKVWDRIKGAFSKVGKFLANLIPKATKIVSKVSPGPIGTVAGIIGDTVDTISTTLNLKGIAS